MGKEEAVLLLDKAKECLGEAQLLYNGGFYPGSVNRSYYSIFNAMQCVLQMLDIMVKTHHGSHIQFNQHYIKTGAFPEEIGKIPQRIEEMRLKGDYEFGQTLTRANAESAIKMAEAFYTAIKNYFDTSK